MITALKYIIGGVLSKALASFDDAVTRIPIIAQLTRTKQGRIAFSIGNLLAVTAAVAMAWCFSSLLEKFSYTHVITSILILVLAFFVYLDLFGKKKEEKIEKEKHKIRKKITRSRFFHLIWLGFFVSIITLLDDFVVLTPLFLGDLKSQIFALIGIYLATFIQLAVMVYLAKGLSKLKHVKEIAVIGLLILSALVYFKVF